MTPQKEKLVSNWCQIGVKTEKITILKEIRYCKPLILKGLQKNNKNISTHLLTVLTISVILHIEQRKGNKKKSSKSGVENVDNTQERSESA